MNLSTYEAEFKVQQTHWWFIVRRNFFSRLIKDYQLPRDAAILDIGVSTGTNLHMLKNMGFTHFMGLDNSEEALRFCAQNGFNCVKLGDICHLPFPDHTFDLVLATDIIEHVDADHQALQEIFRVLKPQGKAIITVPAFKILWGLQDVVSHHKRRYRMNELIKKIEHANFRIKEKFYFNYILFFPILIARKLIQLFRIHLDSENQINATWINRLLKSLFNFDVLTARFIKPPFGVSIVAVVEK